jgi:hypothetical protein
VAVAEGEPRRDLHRAAPRIRRGLAVHRYAFFGRETVSFIVVLPIALPGIITGMALNSFFVFWEIGLSFWTIVIGHATFCIVIVYNNVIARLRRVRSRSRKRRWTSAPIRGGRSAASPGR